MTTIRTGIIAIGQVRHCPRHSYVQVVGCASGMWWLLGCWPNAQARPFTAAEVREHWPRVGEEW